MVNTTKIPPFDSNATAGTTSTDPVAGPSYFAQAGELLGAQWKNITDSTAGQWISENTTYAYNQAAAGAAKVSDNAGPVLKTGGKYAIDYGIRANQTLLCLATAKVSYNYGKQAVEDAQNGKVFKAAADAVFATAWAGTAAFMGYCAYNGNPYITGMLWDKESADLKDASANI